MYLIGLEQAWVFEAPLRAIPISTASSAVASQKEVNAAELDPESVAFLVELLEKSKMYLLLPPEIVSKIG